MTDPEISAASGDLRRDARPPIEMEPAPLPDAAESPPRPLRRTAQRRPIVSPVPITVAPGYPLDHAEARRWWSALLGPGAVADLLRLATAAQRGRSLPRPVHLDQLARHGLVRFSVSRIEVVRSFPPLPRLWLRSVHPLIRREQAVPTSPHRPNPG